MCASHPALGRLPTSWKQVPLGTVTLKIGSGATPRGGQATYLEKRENYALIRSQSVFDRRFDLTSVSYISDAQAALLSNAHVERDDVLLNITGDGVTFSRATRVPREVLPAVVNQHVAIIRPDQMHLDPDYLHCFLTNPKIKPYIEAYNAGGSRRAITKKHIESFLIPLPPISEQRAIGGMLKTLDDKIELNRQMNETLEAMAQAIFKDWFIDFGPVRRKMEGATDPVRMMGGLFTDPARAAELTALFPDTLGDDGLPEGWNPKPLSEIAHFLNGAALQKYPAEPEETGLPVIKIAELRNGITAKTGSAKQSLPEKYIVRNGDFLFSWSGTLMTKVWHLGDGALNQHLFKVTSNSYPQWFFSGWIHQHMPEFRRVAASKATTMGHIQRHHLADAITNCPPSEHFSTLSSILQPISELSLSNDIENVRLAEMRDLLLPNLMSGKFQIEQVSP